MTAVDTTDIGLWGEYYYSWFFGEGIYIPEDYDLRELKASQNAIVPHWNTQHGFMRWNESTGYTTGSNEGLLQIAQPRLTLTPQKDTKPAYWKVDNTAKPTSANKTDCEENADHSETCFIKWLKDNPKEIVEIFTNFSPCCEINKTNQPLCTESLIKYCNKNEIKIRVFFYRWYLPQNQSQGGMKEKDAMNAYMEFLNNQTIPSNLELYKIIRDPAKKDLVYWSKSKWSTARYNFIDKEKCVKIK